MKKTINWDTFTKLNLSLTVCDEDSISGEFILFEARGIFQRFSQDRELTLIDCYEFYQSLTRQILINTLAISRGVKFTDGTILHDPEGAEDFAKITLKQLEDSFNECIAKIPESINNGKTPVYEILQMLKKIDKQTAEKLPDYKQMPLDDGIVNPDMSVKKSLAKLAAYLHKSGFEVTTNMLLEFKDKDGKPFTHGTAQQEASRCKTPKE